MTLRDKMANDTKNHHASDLRFIRRRQCHFRDGFSASETRKIRTVQFEDFEARIFRVLVQSERTVLFESFSTRKDAPQNRPSGALSAVLRCEIFGRV